MSTYQDIELKNLPSLMKGYLKAAGLLIRKSLVVVHGCLLYTSPSPRDRTRSRMPSSA